METAHLPEATASSGAVDSTMSPVSNTPLRTFEDYQASADPSDNVYFSLDSFRIRWPIFGELSDIMVIDDPTDASSTARPFKTADGWHPIAAAPVSYPPISATQISVFALENWAVWADEQCWYCECEECHHAIEGQLAPVHCRGRNPVDDGEGDDLPDCCDCPGRYRAPDPILVTNPEGGAVTILDVITKAHPYLNAHEKEIRIAGALAFEEESEPPLDNSFYMNEGLFGTLSLFHNEEPGSEEREWKERAERARRLRDRGYRDP